MHINVLYIILNRMRKLLISIFIIETISCSKKIDYQNTISAIESNQDLFDDNYSLRGKTNIFYNDSIHYFYLEYDTIEYPLCILINKE